MKRGTNLILGFLLVMGMFLMVVGVFNATYKDNITQNGKDEVADKVTKTLKFESKIENF